MATDFVDDRDDDDGDADRAAVDTEDDALDGLRIRQLAALRRGTARGRSYCIIAAVVCGVAVVQLLIRAAAHVAATGIRPQPIGYGLAAAVAVAGAVYFARRAIDLHRELGRSMLEPPDRPPDFAPLGDGSRRWENLEDIR